MSKSLSNSRGFPLWLRTMVVTTVVTLASLITSGCAQFPGAQSLSNQQKDRLLSGEVLLGKKAAAELELPDKAFLSLTPEMHRFLRRYADNGGSDKYRLQTLVQALHHPGVLGFEYNAKHTYTADEGFFNRAGNCLTFSALLIAMARDLGLKASFNEVEIPPAWGIQGEQTFVLYKHINANVVVQGGKQVIVDVTPDVYQIEYPQRLISDREAEAQYYNNLATEFMALDNRYQAFRHFKKAILLAPKATYLWSNLGTLYRRDSHLKEAELAFNHAITLDSRNLAAISSLERLYLQVGMEEKAEIFHNRAQQVRDKNPYYRYVKAEEAFAKGDFALAVDHMQAALKEYDEDHQFHYLLGLSYVRLGQRVKGAAALTRALELASGDKEKTRYEMKLKWLQAQS